MKKLNRFWGLAYIPLFLFAAFFFLTPSFANAQGAHINTSTSANNMFIKNTSSGNTQVKGVTVNIFPTDAYCAAGWANGSSVDSALGGKFTIPGDYVDASSITRTAYTENAADHNCKSHVHTYDNVDHLYVWCSNNYDFTLTINPDTNLTSDDVFKDWKIIDESDGSTIKDFGASLTGVLPGGNLHNNTTDFHIVAEWDVQPPATVKASISTAGAGSITGSGFGIKCDSTKNTDTGCTVTGPAGTASLAASNDALSVADQKGNFFLGIAKAANGYSFTGWTATYDNKPIAASGNPFLYPVGSGKTLEVIANYEATSSPTCTLDASPATGLAPLVVHVTIPSTTPPMPSGTTYSYTLGDGSAALPGRGTNLYYTYATAGTYNIGAVASTGTACSGKTITVKPPTSGTGGEVAP